jgi:hypothetical protein
MTYSFALSFITALQQHNFDRNDEQDCCVGENCHVTLSGQTVARLKQNYGVLYRNTQCVSKHKKRQADKHAHKNQKTNEKTQQKNPQMKTCKI